MSFPIFCRTCQATENQSHYSARGGGPRHTAAHSPLPTAVAILPPGPPHLDLLDIRVPLAHGLHVLHELFVKPLHGLVHYHLQPEHLAHVWDHFTQHFVPIRLSAGKRGAPRERLEKNIPGRGHVDSARQGRRGTARGTLG